jgi:hypothetical protein
MTWLVSVPLLLLGAGCSSPEVVLRLERQAAGPAQVVVYSCPNEQSDCTGNALTLFDVPSKDAALRRSLAYRIPVGLPRARVVVALSYGEAGSGCLELALDLEAQPRFDLRLALGSDPQAPIEALDCPTSGAPLTLSGDGGSVDADGGSPLPVPVDAGADDGRACQLRLFGFSSSRQAACLVNP